MRTVWQNCISDSRRTFETEPGGVEIIFVDDASPDNSLAVLRDLAERDPRIAVLALKRNSGQHEAILIGLSFAQGRWNIVMDADLQDPPEAIPRLLARGQAELDAVFAGRRGPYESRLRLLTSRIFKSLQGLLAGVPADAGCFVAISQVMRERLLQMRRPFASVVAMIGCTGLPTASVPVDRAARLSGESAYQWHGRFLSGARAILWVLYWKSRGLAKPGDEAEYRKNIARASAAVAEFIGLRFSNEVAA